MKEVIKLIEKVVTQKKIDRHQGLNAVLDFLIDMFDIRHYRTEGGWFAAVKKASEEEPYLFRIMEIWMEKVADAMEAGKWIDFFGGIYEEMYQSKSKASALGQFYTPPELCDLLARCSEPVNGKVNDSACGSGRTLLAAASVTGFDRKNYYVGEDIDVTSVKMCALNLMIHGCKGKVVQHDTLVNPVLYDYAFRINDVRYPIPTPFYSLTRISFTKEDLAKKNNRARERYGENVKVDVYTGYEVVKAKEGAKPTSKPLFVNPPIKKKEDGRRFEPVQLDLFR